jgi:phage terminase small subunit
LNKRNLTSRQELFVSEYLLDLNATKAAIRAGYSSKTAHSCGPRLLDNAAVSIAIKAAKQVRSQATSIDAAWVLAQAVQVYQRCVQEIRPVVHPKTRQQLKDEQGQPVFTFNAAAANQALALIGKHVEVGAFEERLAVSGNLSVAERIMAGRARVRMARVASPATPLIESPRL